MDSSRTLLGSLNNSTVLSQCSSSSLNTILNFNDSVSPLQEVFDFEQSIGGCILMFGSSFMRQRAFSIKAVLFMMVKGPVGADSRLEEIQRHDWVLQVAAIMGHCCQGPPDYVGSESKFFNGAIQHNNDDFFDCA